MLTVNDLFGEEKLISEYIIEGLQNQEQQIEEIKNMNFKERQYTIFKMFYNGLSSNDKDLLRKATARYSFILTRIYSLIDEANAALEHKKISIYNREEACIEIMTQYNSLINKISILAKELNMSNSLELCILYSYLLWNGYFSKTKQNIFKSEGRKFITGLYFADITDGIGVCLNHADMLKDILNSCDYTSVILQNSFDDTTKVNYKIDIERKNIKDEHKSLIEKILKIKKANHVFNLIEENNKIYIYDSTNLLLYNIADSNYSSLINGKGKNKLFPYQSYYFTYSKDEEKLLDRLISESDYTSPYTKEDFISTSEVNLEIIRNSITLLDDFYTEARSNIISISEETDKIMSRQRIR